LRRFLSDLRQFQSDRWLRAEVLREGFDQAYIGIAVLIVPVTKALRTGRQIPRSSAAAVPLLPAVAQLVSLLLSGARTT
jgi:hypothetical protein